MKLAIFLFAVILVSMPASADTNEKIEFQPGMLVEVLDGVKYLANTCETMMSSGLLVNEMEYRSASNSKEKTLARNKRSGVLDDARKCIDTNKSKIRQVSAFITSEMGKRNLLELAKNYIVQAQTTLDATMNEQTFPAEQSKLNAFKNKIDLELSLAK